MLKTWNPNFECFNQIFFRQFTPYFVAFLINHTLSFLCGLFSATIIHFSFLSSCFICSLFCRPYISRSTTLRCTARVVPEKTPSAGILRAARSTAWAGRSEDTTKRRPRPRSYLRAQRPFPLPLPLPRTPSATWRTLTGCSAWRLRTLTSTAESSSPWRSPASKWCTGSSTGIWATTSSTIWSTWIRTKKGRTNELAYVVLRIESKREVKGPKSRNQLNFFTKQIVH